MSNPRNRMLFTLFLSIGESNFRGNAVRQLLALFTATLCLFQPVLAQRYSADKLPLLKTSLPTVDFKSLTPMAAVEDDVVINEFSVNPAAGKEYVELLVVGSGGADMRSWTLSDVGTTAGATSSTEGDVTLPNLSYLSSVPQGTYVVIVLSTPSANSNTLTEDISTSDGNRKLVLIVGTTTGLTTGGTMDNATADNLHLYAGTRAAGTLIDQALAGTNTSFITGTAWGDNNGGTTADNIDGDNNSSNGASAIPSNGSVAFCPTSDTQAEFQNNDTGSRFTTTASSYGTPGTKNTCVTSDNSINQDAAPSVSGTTPADNATGVALNSDITVTFSEAVSAPSAFSISCATSGAHAFALSGGPTTFTLNPDSDFVNGEICTVTVDDLQVSDQDSSDPPDNMAADYVFDFTTVSATPVLTINDVAQNEGSGGGTTSFTFTVSLTTSTHSGVTFDICTADGTAQDDDPAVSEDNDYTANCLTGQSISNGSNSAQFTVAVNGDLITEPNETFFVNVTNVTGATVTDGQGQGTIQNDDITLTPIHDIQGNGASSPLTGQTVTTSGIVTLLRTGSNGGSGTANGFFLQDAVANYDADPNTSEGIFVFTSSVPAVAVGDSVRVTGTVAEFNGLTEITSVTSTSVLSTGNTLPTAVTLDATILDPTAAPTQPQLEKYEGMRMTGTLRTVAPNDNFFDVYTVLSSVARPMREPGIPSSDPIPPDPTSGTPDANIPIWDENPERLKVDTNGRAGAPNSPYTSNVTFTSVSGPLDYAFGEYRLIPDAAPTASANMTAVAVPTPLANEFTIASYNIENFNNGNLTQRQKAADTIRNLLHYPDIIGVVEIDDLAHLEALRDEINNDAVAASDPNPMYAAYLTEGNVLGGGDQNQNVGFLVKTARVSVNSVTQEREEENYTEPGGGTAFLHDRPPLVLDAIVDPSGTNPRRVLVVVNHLRSFIDIDLVAGDGPRVREKRKKQAESLADLLNDLQTANPGVPVISVGDYNEYEFSSGYDDSMSVIKGNPTADDQIVVDQSPDLVDPNLTNLTDTITAAERYSFVFEGTPQGLDHHVINQAARARNTRVAIARVNSDFPEDPAATYASNAATPERNSDHDPVVSYYSLSQAQTAGSVIISEFRFRGPGSGGPPPPTLSEKPGIKTPTLAIGNQAEDEFVEIYNNTNSAITVSTIDGSAGWALVGADGVTRFVIPNGTVIPARGHFLGVNSDGYSLSNYGGPGAAAGDSVLLADGVTPASGYTQDIPDGSGIALFSTANSDFFTLDNRLDAAGYSTAPALYREGDGFAPGGAETTGGLEHTFFRAMTRATGGLPKDTGNNTADFYLADTAGTDFDLGPGTSQRLGAPGPENLSSPINSTAQFGVALLDPNVSDQGVPNRSRNFTAVPNGVHGTLTLRRTFTNNTGQLITSLRFRIVEITTFPASASSAQLHALSSADSVVETTVGPKDVRGTVLEEPPAQALGGGWNSSLRVTNVGLPAELPAKIDPKTGTLVLRGGLNPGQSIDVQFSSGVMKTGIYFFYIVIEPRTSSVVSTLKH